MDDGNKDLQAHHHALRVEFLDGTPDVLLPKILLFSKKMLGGVRVVTKFLPARLRFFHRGNVPWFLDGAAQLLSKSGS